MEPYFFSFLKSKNNPHKLKKQKGLNTKISRKTAHKFTDIALKIPAQEAQPGDPLTEPSVFTLSQPLDENFQAT